MRVAREIWEAKGITNGLFNAQIATAIAGKLWSGVTEGYGKDLPGLDFDTPDYKMLHSIQQNIWTFSAAKNYHQLRQLTDAMIGLDGKLRAWDEFKREAFTINELHVKQWLKAEYNVAVGGAQMASKWTDIQDTKDVFPLLQFDAVLDTQTTGLCRSLHGTILPVGHPFWDTYYPPNHFGCRSTVRKLTSGTVTQNIPSAEIPAMFETNTAKSGIIFPPGHPYWKDIPKSVLSEALKTMPYDGQFSRLDKVGAGWVREHANTDRNAKDYATVRSIAIDKAMRGAKVDIMPTISERDAPDYKIIFHDAKAGKCPDLRINGKLVEVEGSKNSKNLNNLKHAVSAGYKQANHVIVDMSQENDRETLYRVAKGRFIDHKDLERIEFRFNSEYQPFTRDDIK